MEEINCGTIRIADEVLADIAIKAALEVDGVIAVRQRMFDGAKNLVSGKVTVTKGVILSPSEAGLDVTVQVVVRFGCKIQNICALVQEEVAEAIGDMTGIQVRQVNVAVVGIVAVKRNCKKMAN